MTDVLQRIQTLQFEHRTEAEALLLPFIQDVYSKDVVQVELRPLAVSLNSFNGYITLRNGKRLFFKTHTEPDTVIGEYYNASKLADAGYPIIRPIFSSTDVGRQLLIYEVVNSASVFDIAWAIENGDDSLFDDLKIAQEDADRKLLTLYLNSLESQSEDQAAKAPIHQLFYHRLTGGRLNRFYGDEVPDDSIGINILDETYSMKSIRNIHWNINGQVYDETLNEIIGRATTLLFPKNPSASVVGHGDAHNGNVFFNNSTNPPSLVYFDPAFAGRHSPLLDLAKPLFHNVFAMWMYYPQVKAQSLSISVQAKADVLFVEHDYEIPPVREMFFESKVKNTLIPLLRKLRSDHLLQQNWRETLKAALFCCPFLTMNLADSQKFPSAISLLGLLMSVEMGADSKYQRSKIDLALDEVEGQIN